MTENKTLPLVTVVIASYNHEKYVAQAVMSALSQSETAIEVIVVDDGSSDTTPEVVATLDDSRIRLIRLKKNRVFHPRNIGIKNAQGKYVAFQNSDDVWSHEKLDAQIKYLEAHEDCVACFSGVEIIDGYGNKAPDTWAKDSFTTKNRSSPEWLRQFFFHGNCLCISSAIVSKKALVQAGNFRPSLIQLSDLDLWIRLAIIGNLYVIEEPLTKMRIVKGQNLSRPSQATRRRSHVEFSEVLTRYLDPTFLERFEEVFPEWSKCQEKGAQKAALALHNLGKRGGRTLFADRTISSILDNQSERDHALAVHGSDIMHRFLENRAKIILRWKHATFFKRLKRRLYYE